MEVRGIASGAETFRLFSFTQTHAAQHSAWVLPVFLACLVFSLWATSVGWTHSVLDLYGFRQAQTAITVDYLLKGSPWLAYWTPVMGPPWSIPFEFPLYQWLVALLVNTTGMSLDPAGRAVSVLFYYLSYFPAFSLLGSLGVARRDRLIFLCLLLVSPLYIFWSRTFMIESTAMFFSMSYLAFVARFLERRLNYDVAFACVFGTVAAAVKVTTFHGYLLAAFFLVLRDLIRFLAQIRGDSLKRALAALIKAYWAPALAFAVVPILILYFWTQFADAQKSLNPLAANFVTSGKLHQWTFGTLEQRLSFPMWFSTIFARSFHDVIGQRITWLLSIAGIIFAGRRRKEYFVSLAIFLAVYLTFTNLHVVHKYYPYGNGVFLIASLGWCIIALLESGRLRRKFGMALFALALVGCLYEYRRGMFKTQSQNHLQWESLAKKVQDTTRPEDVVLMYGYDWSPEIPYYLRRKTIMDRDDRSLDHAEMKIAIENIDRGGYQFGALIVCGERPKIRDAAIERFGFNSTPVHSQGCEVYLRTPDG